MLCGVGGWGTEGGTKGVPPLVFGCTFFGSRTFGVFSILFTLHGVVNSRPFFARSSIVVVFSAMLSLNAMGVEFSDAPSDALLDPLTPILHYGIVSTATSDTSFLGSDLAPSDSGDFICYLVVRFFNSAVVHADTSLSELSDAIVANVLPVDSKVEPCLAGSY